MATRLIVTNAPGDRLIVVHISTVRDRPRRWYVYADSAQRAIDSGKPIALHTKPYRRGYHTYAIVEDVE